MRRTALLLTLTLLAGLGVAAPAAAAPAAAKVTICHKPGTPAEQTITVALPALAAHAAHGDYPGECGTAPGDGTDPGDGTGETPIDACTAINQGSFENLQFRGDEVIHVVLDFTGYPGHVIWFHVCNADGCALIYPRPNYQAHDEFDFPWEREGLWEEGPITIGLDIRPAPAAISITCSHRTGP
jgi:hypothetical protein